MEEFRGGAYPKSLVAESFDISLKETISLNGTREIIGRRKRDNGIETIIFWEDERGLYTAWGRGWYPLRP